MTVSTQIIEVLDAICERFGIAIDWTSENIIPYATTLLSKLVSYEIWTSVAFMVFMLILAIVLALFLKKTWPRYHNNVDYAMPVSIISVVIVGAVIAAIISQTMQIIKCITFPELFVYGYVSNFIKNVH